MNGWQTKRNKMCILEIRNKGAKHCYDVYVSLSEYVSVTANNRASAAKIVRELGHEVWSVNMVS